VGIKGDKHSVEGHQFAVLDALQTSKPRLETFSHASAIGFAILDNQLRYQAINNCLASINGIPAEAHLGFSVREIFGALSKTAEPSDRRVLGHGEISNFEVTNAALPTRSDARYWGLNINVPIQNSAGRVQQIGIMVVEVTKQRQAKMFFRELTAELRHRNTRESFWLAQELQDSNNQYHAALTMSLESLIRPPEKSTELIDTID
jgi:hypothetical protein